MCGAGNGSVLVLYLRCRCIGLRLGLRLLYMQKSTRASGAQYMYSKKRHWVRGYVHHRSHVRARAASLGELSHHTRMYSTDA